MYAQFTNNILSSLFTVWIIWYRLTSEWTRFCFSQKTWGGGAVSAPFAVQMVTMAVHLQETLRPLRRVHNWKLKWASLVGAGTILRKESWNAVGSCIKKKKKRITEFKFDVAKLELRDVSPLVGANEASAMLAWAWINSSFLKSRTFRLWTFLEFQWSVLFFLLLGEKNAENN